MSSENNDELRRRLAGGENGWLSWWPASAAAMAVACLGSYRRLQPEAGGGCGVMKYRNVGLCRQSAWRLWPYRRRRLKKIFCRSINNGVCNIAR